MPLTAARRATLAALADSILPHGGALEPGARDVNVAGQLDSYLDRCAPGTRRTVDLMLTAFNLSSIASRQARPFRMLGPAAREAYLMDCEKSKIRQRRETLIALKALILMFFCSDDRIKPLIGYDAQPYKKVERDPGVVELKVMQPDQGFYDTADVVVVGSGAGGAVATMELAESGLKVIVLEEGEHFDRRDFTGSPPERLRRFYRGNGLTFTIGVPTISLPIGRGVGGSTLINSGACFRTPDFVLDAWGMNRSELEPLFEDVEETLSVEPVGIDIMGTNGGVMDRGRRELGYSGGPIRRNAHGCHGSGVCAFGCPLDAKLGMHVTYLPLAVRAGAQIISGCRVDGLVIEGGRAVGVRGSIVDPETGAVQRDARFEVRARRVVLAAGAVYTPALLQRQGLANSSRQVGRNLRVHPGCGVLGVFDHDWQAWKGVMQSYYVDEKLRDGILVEATYPPPGAGYSAVGVGGKGSDLKDVLARDRDLPGSGRAGGAHAAAGVAGGAQARRADLDYTREMDGGRPQALRIPPDGDHSYGQGPAIIGRRRVRTCARRAWTHHHGRQRPAGLDLREPADHDHDAGRAQRTAPRRGAGLNGQRDPREGGFRCVLECGGRRSNDMGQGFRSAHHPELQVSHLGVVAEPAAAARV